MGDKDDLINELQVDLSAEKDYHALYKEALKEACKFIMKRTPRDAREGNASVEYFETVFTECARVILTSGEARNGSE